MKKIGFFLMMLVLFAAVMALEYLLFCFIEWSLNPSLWHFWTRVVLAAVWFSQFIFMWLAFSDNSTVVYHETIEVPQTNRDMDAIA